MKQWALILVLFIVFAACSKPVKERILGKWQLSKVGMETLSASDTDASLEFMSDGKLIILVDGDSSVCKWEVNKDENAIILLNAKDQKKNWNIVALSDFQLVYIEENDTTKITYIK